MSSRTLKGNRFSLIALFKFSAPALLSQNRILDFFLMTGMEILNLKKHGLIRLPDSGKPLFLREPILLIQIVQAMQTIKPINLFIMLPQRGIA